MIQSDTIDILRQGCQEERERYRQTEQLDEPHCLALFQRAAEDCDEAAWKGRNL